MRLRPLPDKLERNKENFSSPSPPKQKKKSDPPIKQEPLDLSETTEKTTEKSDKTESNGRNLRERRPLVRPRAQRKQLRTIQWRVDAYRKESQALERAEQLQRLTIEKLEQETYPKVILHRVKVPKREIESD